MKGAIMGVFGWLQADTVAAVWTAAAAIHREKNTVEAAAAAGLQPQQAAANKLMLNWIVLLFCLVKVLLLIPVEFLRWVIIALAGGASYWFIALNLKECTEGADLMVLTASASLLQFTLALFIKVFFFAWGEVCLLILQRSASLFLTPSSPGIA
jgi:hypothetical protein